MAYAEICACIRTLQEATFQQESEIFRLREREAHLKQLVADLTEKLHGSKDALIRNGNVSAGLDKSHSRDNRESSSQDSRLELAHPSSLFLRALASNVSTISLRS